MKIAPFFLFQHTTKSPHMRAYILCLLYSTTPQSRNRSSFRFSLGVNHFRFPSLLVRTLIGILFDRRRYAFICVFRSS